MTRTSPLAPEFDQFFNPNNIENLSKPNPVDRDARNKKLIDKEFSLERLQASSDAKNYLNRLFRSVNSFEISEFQSYLKKLDINQLSALDEEATELYQERKSAVAALMIQFNRTQKELTKRCKRAALPAIAGGGGTGMGLCKLGEQSVSSSTLAGQAQLISSLTLLAAASLYAFGPYAWYNYFYAKERSKLQKVCAKVNLAHESIFDEKRKKISQPSPIYPQRSAAAIKRQAESSSQPASILNVALENRADAPRGSTAGRSALRADKRQQQSPKIGRSGSDFETTQAELKAAQDLNKSQAALIEKLRSDLKRAEEGQTRLDLPLRQDR